MVITVTCPSCSTSFPVDPAKIPEGGVNARCSSCGDVFRVEKPVEAEPLPTLEDLGPSPQLAPAPEPPPLPEASVPAEPEAFESAEPEAIESAEPEAFESVEPEAIESAEPEAFESVEYETEASDDWVVETDEGPQVEPEPLPSFTDEPPTLAEPEVAEPESSAGAAIPVSDPFSEPAPFEQAAPAGETLPEPGLEQEPAAAQPAPAEPAVQGFTFGKRDPTDKAKRLARVLVSDMIMYNAERHQSALASGTLVQDFEEEIEKSWKEYVEQVGDDIANGAGRQFWTDALNDILAKGKQVF
jgi:predicted Zn finger-like uncharacterized protein